jgi:hypothetical protein
MRGTVVEQLGKGFQSSFCAVGLLGRSYADGW